MTRRYALVQYEGPSRGFRVYQIDPRKDYHGYLETDAWAEKRAAALEAAEYVCVRCGAERRLQVHHKTYKTLGSERPQDLEVLCSDCHLEEHFHLSDI